jgi:hypothetical protein
VPRRLPPFLHPRLRVTRRLELGTDADAAGRTGIATLRRDGFASVNAAAEELQVEGTDIEVHAIEAFSRANCQPFRDDLTLQEIRWKDDKDLQFRFLLIKRSLYFFWLSTDPTGACNSSASGSLRW